MIINVIHKVQVRSPSNALNRLFSKSQKPSFYRCLILLAKTAKSRFVPPFGGHSVNLYVSSMARWNVRGELRISNN